MPATTAIFRRFPCSPGQRRKPSDIFAALPDELANPGHITIVGAVLTDSASSWTVSEIPLSRYYQSKPVAPAEVPTGLSAWLRWNPEDESSPYKIITRKRLNFTKLRAAWNQGALL